LPAGGEINRSVRLARRRRGAGNGWRAVGQLLGDATTSTGLWSVTDHVIPLGASRAGCVTPRLFAYLRVERRRFEVC
jgi:hypothetical protein